MTTLLILAASVLVCLIQIVFVLRTSAAGEDAETQVGADPTTWWWLGWPM
jgi:hypothetical protein